MKGTISGNRGFKKFIQVAAQVSVQITVMSCLIAGLTACGKTATGKNSNADELGALDFSTRRTGSGGDVFNPTGGNTNNSTTPTSTSEDSLPDVKRLQIRGIGYDTPVKLTVRTKNLLKVKFQPEQNDRKVADSNIVPKYSGLSVNIKVGDSDNQTPLLSNGAEYDKQASDIYTYSGDIEDPCDSDDELCSTNVEITISMPNYNYWQWSKHIFYFWNADETTWDYYPTHSHVYETHPWAGLLFVQTNFTKTLKTGVQ